MRWIFFSLLLANIAVYIWHSMEVERKARIEQLNASAVSTATVQGRPLVLVSELTEEEKNELANRPVEVPAPEKVAPEVVITEKAEPEKIAAGKPPASAPEVVPAPLAPASAAALWPPNQCLMLGPVSDKQYDQIAQRLLARSIVPERQLVDTKGALEYWVVLPPFDDEKQAVAKLQEIQGRGVQGQIIPKGELANAIAFGGVFSQQAEAEQLAEKMRVKGLKVEVRAVAQVRQEKWAVLSERQAPKLGDDLWQEIHQDFPGIKKQTKNCH